jgi:hypothetical protein
VKIGYNLDVNRALPFVLTLAIPFLIGAGNPVSEGETRNPIRIRVSAGADVSPDITSALQNAIRTKQKPSLFNSTITNLPSFVREEQIQSPFTRWTVGSVHFLLVQQRNFITYLNIGYEDVRWAGILVSTDSGVHWNKFFTITNPIVDLGDGHRVENPVNVERVFIRGGLLYLDLTDGNGAGSGEGHLTRLQSRDGGRSWRRIACLYFLPEDYYPSINDRPYGSTGYSDLSIATPFKLHTPAECSYP